MRWRKSLAYVPRLGMIAATFAAVAACRLGLLADAPIVIERLRALGGYVTAT